MMPAKKLLAVVATLAIAMGLLPLHAFAAGNLVSVTDPSLFDNGTYVFDSVDTSTGMIPVDSQDGPAMAIVNGNDVTLVVDVYAPGKYDKMYPGKRTEAPDPSANGLLYGQFVPAGDYEGKTEKWTDTEGRVGPAGNTYKSVRFLIPMTKPDFIAMLNNGKENDLYIAVRRAAWSPSNPLKWMGSNDHYVTFGTPVKTSSSVDLPETGFSLPNNEGSEDPIVRVKALIEALPKNPYTVVESDRAAINEAQAAYGALPAESQKQLDSEKTSAAQSYGRTLESLVWALDTLRAVDDSTTLPDGTYTTQATSTCSLGKSDSARGRMFHLVKVVVKDGRAQALIEHDTSASDTVRIGSKEYPHVNANEDDHSQFLIPVDLNSTFHISQLAKNPTANTLGIVYEMNISIDEANAKPDAESPSGPAGTPNVNGQRSSNTSSSNGTRNNSSALSAVAQARQSGTAGKASKSGSASKDEEAVDSKKADSTSTAPSGKRAASAVDVAADADAGSESGDPPDTLPLAFGMLGTSTILGAGGFSIAFFRREKRLAP